MILIRPFSMRLVRPNCILLGPSARLDLDGTRAARVKAPLSMLCFAFSVGSHADDLDGAVTLDDTEACDIVDDSAQNHSSSIRRYDIVHLIFAATTARSSVCPTICSLPTSSLSASATTLFNKALTSPDCCCRYCGPSAPPSIVQHFPMKNYALANEAHVDANCCTQYKVLCPLSESTSCNTAAR